MKILIATFDHNYYLWQILVQINNFMKHGYDKDTIYIIASSNPSPVLKSLINNPKIKSKFYIYNDERTGVNYPVTLRHHILEKFYIEHPEYNNESIFLVDPDMIFTKKLDFTKMLSDDCWYLSDTRSYIDSKYIRNKSEKLFEEMCDIVEVSTEDIISKDDAAGGAQYLLKNINSNFWKKSFNDSEKLYNHMKNTESIYNSNGTIQSWTADMWSILWNGIYFGHDIKIDKDLDFCWATDNIKKWEETYIFHNAGVIGKSDVFFSKIEHQNSPFNQNIKVNENNCTYNYLKEIKETEENFKDILW